MSDNIIKRIGTSVGLAKDIKNVIASIEKIKAFMDYIAVVDYPEMLEEDEEEIE